MAVGLPADGEHVGLWSDTLAAVAAVKAGRRRSCHPALFGFGPDFVPQADAQPAEPLDAN